MALATDEGDLLFGYESSIDLILIDGKSALHIVDTAPRFNSASFLDAHCETYGHSVYVIRSTFSNTRVTMYTGYPNRLQRDQGSVYTLDRLYPNVPEPYTRKMAVKAINDTTGEYGPVPSRLVFGIIQFPYFQH